MKNGSEQVFVPVGFETTRTDDSDCEDRVFKEEDIKDRLDTLVNDALKKKEDVKNIYDQLYDAKIMDVLRKNFIIVEKSGSYEDFIAFTSGKEAEEKPAAKKKAPAKKKAAEKAEGEEGEAKPKAKTTRAKKTEATAEGEEKPKAKTSRKSTKKFISITPSA